MKRIFTFLSILLSPFFSFSQVKIGPPGAVNSSSILELESTDKGLYLPRVSLTGAVTNWGLAGTAPTGTANGGMTLYNTNAAFGAGVGIYYWDGSQWRTGGASGNGANVAYAQTFAVAAGPYRNLKTINFTSQGGKILLNAGFNFNPGGGTRYFVEMEIARDGTVISAADVALTSSADGTSNLSWIDEPAAGPHVYTLTYTTGTGAAVPTIYGSWLQIIEFK